MLLEEVLDVSGTIRFIPDYSEDGIEIGKETSEIKTFADIINNVEVNNCG